MEQDSKDSAQSSSTMSSSENQPEYSVSRVSLMKMLRVLLSPRFEHSLQTTEEKMDRMLEIAQIFQTVSYFFKVVSNKDWKAFFPGSFWVI